MFETIDNLSPSNPPNSPPQGAVFPARMRPIQPNQPLQMAQSQMQNPTNPSPPENFSTRDGIQELPEDIFGANPGASEIEASALNTELKPVGAMPQFLRC